MAAECGLQLCSKISQAKVGKKFSLCTVNLKLDTGPNQGIDYNYSPHTRQINLSKKLTINFKQSKEHMLSIELQIMHELCHSC